MLVNNLEFFECDISDWFEEWICKEAVFLAEKLTFVKKENVSNYDTWELEHLDTGTYLNEKLWNWLKDIHQSKIVISPKSVNFQIGSDIFSKDNHLGRTIVLDFKQIEINLLPIDYNIVIDKVVYPNDMLNGFNKEFQIVVKELFEKLHPNISFSEIKYYDIVFPEGEIDNSLGLALDVALDNLREIFRNWKSCGFYEGIEQIRDDYNSRNLQQVSA